MQEFVGTGRVRNGKLVVRNPQRFADVLKGWRDCDVEIIIAKKHATRSLSANAYYWGVVVHHISEHTGYTPEETHEALKQMFLPKQLAMCKDNGDVCGALVIGGSTRKLTTVEFYEYVERCRTFAREQLNIETPSPDSLAA